MNSITKAWSATVAFVRPDVDAIIAKFLKAQSKLDAFIKREEASLAAETKALEAIAARRVTRNATINRAYRIIHNLDTLFA
jgi:hypothetical protein